jgi:hypothetical protein
MKNNILRDSNYRTASFTTQQKRFVDHDIHLFLEYHTKEFLLETFTAIPAQRFCRLRTLPVRTRTGLEVSPYHLQSGFFGVILESFPIPGLSAVYILEQTLDGMTLNPFFNIRAVDTLISKLVENILFCGFIRLIVNVTQKFRNLPTVYVVDKILLIVFLRAAGCVRQCKGY